MGHDGGDAFPRPYQGTDGMTLWDYYVGQALVGLLANTEEWSADSRSSAKRCGEIADALVAAREQRRTQ